MLAESSACRSCAQAFRKKTSKERPYAGISELEPMLTWRCPEPRCPYWIFDEESVVSDAVKHHEREAHERVERLEAELLRARERQLVLRDEREFWHGRAVVAENEVKRLRSLGQRNDEDLGHLTINYGL